EQSLSHRAQRPARTAAEVHAAAAWAGRTSGQRELSQVWNVLGKRAVLGTRASRRGRRGRQESVRADQPAGGGLGRARTPVARAEQLEARVRGDGGGDEAEHD